MNSSFRRLLSLVAVFFIAFAGVSAMKSCRAGGGLFDWLRQTKNQNQTVPEKFTLPEHSPVNLGEVEGLSRLNDEYANLTQAVVPSVVSIDTAGVRTEQMLDFWGRTSERRYPTQGQGSGVIVTNEGHVVTNHHVIAGQQQIQVTLHGGKVYPARLIGEDSLLDIAVLKINGPGPFTPLKLGDSAQVKVGQIVFAVGNAFGLGETVTQGIISAKERSISDNQRDLFQTDAAINPGNSGGPLINLRGEIIGINVAIYSPDKQNPGFQGVGFSIPSNDVREALYQILERGRPVRGFLGVQMRDLTPAIRNLLGYEETGGSVVIGVSPGSPAQLAGLQPKDVVLSYNGKPIESSNELFSMVQNTKVGNTATLGVWRDGKTIELKAVITESGATDGAPQAKQGGKSPGLKNSDTQKVLQAIGLDVRDLSVQERMQGFRGVVVTGVHPEGLAAKYFQPGDLIMTLNNSRISGATEFFVQLADSASSQTTMLHILRGNQVLRVSMPAIADKS